MAVWQKGRSKGTSMRIISFYVAFVLIGDVGAYLIGRSVEFWSEPARLPVFLGYFFLVFWIAWRLAVKGTEPKLA
jgi:hypothetical protein